jgi:hypothetical protein
MLTGSDLASFVLVWVWFTHLLSRHFLDVAMKQKMAAWPSG